MYKTDKRLTKPVLGLSRKRNRAAKRLANKQSRRMGKMAAAWGVALASLSAQADVATVVAIRGDVFTQEKKLRQGDFVVEGDTITVKDKSFTVLRFRDGGKVTIRPSSELTIAKYSEKEGVELSLVTGGLRVLTGAIAKSNPENYKLSADTVLMGVRGTEFLVEVVND